MTLDTVVYITTLVAVLGGSLIAGLFFAFSAFVMNGLARLPHHEGIASMQAMNQAVYNPLFMLVFVGTPVVCIASSVCVLILGSHPALYLILAGNIVHVVGSFIITAACNVPMNNALMEVAPDSKAGSEFWVSYLARWTAWNHVRTVLSLVSVALLVVALSQGNV